jgi:transcriptional regulator with XRE-family HTH domain
MGSMAFSVPKDGNDLGVRIGNAIRAERARRSLTQQQLAQALGISRPTVIAAEAGQNVGSRSLLSMVAYFGLSVYAQPAAGGFSIERVHAKSRPLLKDLVVAERGRQARLAKLRAGDVQPATNKLR